MEKGFFKFVMEPSKESFLEARRKVVEHKDYDPYSFILDDLIELLKNNEFEKVAYHEDINLLLSPKAHLCKREAYKQMGMQRQSEIAQIIAKTIVQCISLTGEGTKEEPFIVTKVQDEYDFLEFVREEIKKQSLIKGEDRVYDKIETKSGKVFFFDITDCHAMARKINPDEFVDRLFGEDESEKKEPEQKEDIHEETKKKKKWKFWKNEFKFQ